MKDSGKVYTEIEVIKVPIADVPGLIKKKIDAAVRYGGYHNPLFSIPPAALIRTSKPAAPRVRIDFRGSLLFEHT